MAYDNLTATATPLNLRVNLPKRRAFSKCERNPSNSDGFIPLSLNIILLSCSIILASCHSITTTTITPTTALERSPDSLHELRNSINITGDGTLTTVAPLSRPSTKLYNQVDFLVDQVNTALNIAFNATSTSAISSVKNKFHNNNFNKTDQANTRASIATLKPKDPQISAAAATTSTFQLQHPHTTQQITKKTSDNLIEDDFTTPTTPTKTTTTTVSESTTTTIIGDDDASARHDDDDVADCAFLSDDSEEEGKRLSNNERFIKLQNCIQGRIQQHLKASRRGGLELFESMNLSGGCVASLMNLMAGLGSLKSYAFKFMDASAKIPSGVMYGLLSDFGDFDQCLSIRSNPSVDIEHEAEEHEFSGKYCLVNLRLNYHVDLEPNKTHLEGIIPDSLLWDDLIKNYWISKAPKPFQMGMCVPSRCDRDDLSQLVATFGRRFNSVVEIQSCQDNFDLVRQHRADLVQTTILVFFSLNIILTFFGTFLDRYRPYVIYLVPSQIESDESERSGALATMNEENNRKFYVDADRMTQSCSNSICNSEFSRTTQDLGVKGSAGVKLWCQLLICFSLRRNWRIFIRKNPDSWGPKSASQTRPGVAQEQTVLSQTLQSRTPTVTTLHEYGEDKQIGDSVLMKQANMNTANQFPMKPRSASALDLNLTLDLPDSQQQNLKQNLQHQHRNSRSQNQIMFLDDSPMLSGDQMKQMQQLTIKIQPNDGFWHPKHRVSLSHLSGLRLFVIVWITMGMSFLYPSANNYQYYRSIINMNITRNSVWFTTTNYTLGIDMLLYMTGLVFVYKFAQVNFSNLNFQPSNMITMSPNSKRRVKLNSWAVVGLISKKILRFWPTYITLIGLAICSPLISNGPMWPEMVNKRLGEACRENWWSNILFVNNFLKESEICLPSSWFVSVIMQLFIIGSIIIMINHKYSLDVAIFATGLLLLLSCSYSFSFAYTVDLPAPVIRMDESFVMKINENIFRLYTNIFNNLGPFLIGMLGGLFLIRETLHNESSEQISMRCKTNNNNLNKSPGSSGKAGMATAGGGDGGATSDAISAFRALICKIPLWPIVLIMAIIVLTSVLHQSYSRFWSAVYWSSHRICWAISTGYLIHQCATYKWRLLHDILSLSSFIPISRLIFITYLVFPAFIHMHSGLVRDGLHVTIYNMANVYVTRLVMATVTALTIHLLVELPFCSIEEILLNRWFSRINKKQAQSPVGDHSLHPLLVVASFVSVPVHQQQQTNSLSSPATTTSTATITPKDILKTPSRAPTPASLNYKNTFQCKQ